nr:hypothetical protein CFP56_69548 [Quercus suber]
MIALFMRSRYSEWKNVCRDSDLEQHFIVKLLMTPRWYLELSTSMSLEQFELVEEGNVYNAFQPDAPYRALVNLDCCASGLRRSRDAGV